MTAYLDDDDVRLMLAFQAGSESSFEALVERHKDRVFAMAYRFLGNYQAAEDAAQEIFVKVYREKARYRPQAKFTTWLYAISKNTCLKALRPRHPATVSLDEPVALEEGSAPLQIADPAAITPSDALARREEAAAVKEAIDSLVPHQKMAVILSRFDGLSYEEISRVMGVSVKAVKSLLHRAKSELKERLAALTEKRG